MTFPIAPEVMLLQSTLKDARLLAVVLLAATYSPCLKMNSGSPSLLKSPAVMTELLVVYLFSSFPFVRSKTATAFPT